MEEIKRKLATIQRIVDIKLINGADKICAYKTQGWWTVDLLDKYKVGDLVIYFEIDSWIPHELAPFLSKGQEPREYNGVVGERLKTIKLRGQVSQGLLLPLSILGDAEKSPFDYGLPGQTTVEPQEGADVTEILNVQKWERPIPAQLSGVVKGNFPSFIRKTDQERVQNLAKFLQKWEEEGDTLFEVSEKLDGSSCTIYCHNGSFGVCSRNLDLKEDNENSFWRVARRYRTAIEDYCFSNPSNLAFQGELVGPGVQNNRYNLNDLQVYLFDIWDIDKQEYVDVMRRGEIQEAVGMVNVPMLGIWQLNDINEMLSLAEGRSILNPAVEREGLVWKSIRTDRSFKTISNKFLLKGGD